MAAGMPAALALVLGLAALKLEWAALSEPLALLQPVAAAVAAGRVSLKQIQKPKVLTVAASGQKALAGTRRVPATAVDRDQAAD